MKSLNILFLIIIICFFTQSIRAEDTIYSAPKIVLVELASGFNKVTDISSCGDNRLFITEQSGKIWILDNLFNKSATPYLDITARVNDSGYEQGLLGLVFHPSYNSNGYFYVNYVGGTGNGRTMVTRYKVKPSDPGAADPAVEDTLLRLAQPYSNHNGGDLNFGPDGFLYIGMGDGGLGGDPEDRAQNKKNLFGKILRLNVDEGLPYSIPVSNPFVGNSNYFPEIWALGLRNPWRHSFDRLNGDFWIGDVGQNAWEEVDYQPASSPGGENYGWRCYEGNHNYNTSGCGPISSYDAPVFEYSHPGGNSRSITGGYVFRGSKFPGLYGKYICTDFLTGDFYIIEKGAGASFPFVKQSAVQTSISTFGENNEGELFAASSATNSKIYRVTDGCNGFKLTRDIQPACDGSNGSITLDIIGGTGSKIISWNTGSSSNTINGLVPATYRVTVTDQASCVISDSIVLSSVASVKPAINYNSISYVLSSTAASTYAWYKDGAPYLISSVNQDQQTTTATSWGDYYVLTTDNNGCIRSSDTITITLTGIKEDKSNAEALSLFPNPVNEKIMISLKYVSGMKAIQFISADGRTVKNVSIRDAKQQVVDLDISDIPAGIYSILVSAVDGNTFVSRLVKM